jgi:uncharacterized protein (TIGR02246 family)
LEVADNLAKRPKQTKLKEQNMKGLHMFVMVSLMGLFLATSETYLPRSSAFVAPSQTERKEVKVWVNTSSGVYHCPGTRWYGNTEQGKYMSECAAIQDGNRPAYGKACGSDCLSVQTTPRTSAHSAKETNEEDERTIRGMVDQAVARLNKGDVSALDDFWDEGADYVGVDGTLIKGRDRMQSFFRKMAEASTGHQVASIEQIRFITPELAIVDGSWTVTGAKGADGKELAPIRGRGFEIVQKKDGKWRFVATREMVIFKGS